MELKIFLLTRMPRLLAVLCTGVGMSVAGLIMQQLCMNKFVSPSTGATIQFCSVVGEDVLFFPEMNFINAFFELTQDSFEPEQLKKSQPVSPKK